MGTRCETEGKYLVSIFRSLVAKKLVNVHRLTQVETAKKIGATQASVSQYICSKRAKVASKQRNGVLPKIQTLANMAAQRLAKGETNWEQVSRDFCKACSKGFETEIEQTADHYII
jgi:predicted transcriptional regulator